ncbi:nicotinamidase-related amidase [Geothermobacter ehrlichii]|uniref:Nicotinamidase-related amidase n=1 Tax=Geothermobacter ehrlichii TaxID=213224 RepID=A0A5D3WM10_9BACT|nr:isochorismatase family cysteine hydrolase [Geothermobacter ehrlichii]TYO98322.1 nicotinamidase-related amidase [Geothermobacter ehrlichii]
MRQALVIIDMLNDFVQPGAPLEVPATREILPALQQRLRQARAQGLPVIHVCDAHAPDDSEFSRMGWPPHAVRGTRGAQIVDELAPLPGETTVCKTTYSGFHATDLDEHLRRLQVDELVLTGCVTSICVLYTAADAVMRGYRVRVPADCVAHLDPGDGAFALRQMRQVLGVDVEED